MHCSCDYNSIMSKSDDKKKQKHDALLNAAYKLITTKGINNTSIADIVEQAGVAKGTFYLYFKDKYDINNKLILHRTTMLFDDAMHKLASQNYDNINDKMIFIINDIIDALSRNKILLMFISKNLSRGMFSYALENSPSSDYSQFHNAYNQLIKEAGDSITDPLLMLYLIIELTAGSIYSSILYNQPVPIEDLKPHLYTTISGIIAQFTRQTS